MEATIKSRSDTVTVIPFNETQHNAAELLKSIKSSVKLPLTGNSSSILLPTANLPSTIAATMSNLISSNTTLPLVRASSALKISNNDFLNPVHSAFGSPFPVAIVNPQPHVDVVKKSDVSLYNPTLGAATVVLGEAPRLKHASESSSIE